MKKTIKRKINLHFKKIVSKIVLYFLYKGFKVVSKKDENVKREIESWENNFTIKIDIGIDNINLKIKKENGNLIRIKETDNLDLEICFKSIDVAFLMLTGRLGISKAYAEHRFTLKGDISKAMSLVRCIDIIEAYLFPKIIARNILKKIPDKTMGILKCYTMILFER